MARGCATSIGCSPNSPDGPALLFCPSLPAHTVHTAPPPDTAGPPDSNASTLTRSRQRVGLVLKQKWKLDALLGIGGMAAVYAATHRNGGRAAIKMLHPEYSALNEVKRRFLREGYVANTVMHTGVVRVLDDDVTEDGAAFLVMDLLIGETLDARLERRGGKLPAEEALPILDDLLDILAAAHEARVVHRDVKPENVFVTTEGAVKLLDFGIARLQSIQPGSLATVDGTTFGTPAFMPPEQALGHVEEIDARSDLWGAGAVLFTTLTGRLVHQTRTLNEQLVAHASRPAPPLLTVEPAIDSHVGVVVDRALAFAKVDRWSDARQMQAAIREVETKLGWPRSISLAFRADPPVLSSGQHRAVAAGEAAALFPSLAESSDPLRGRSMAATSSAIAPRREPGSQRWTMIAGVMVGMITSLAALFFFAARRTPEAKPVDDRAATSHEVAAPAPATAPTPEPSAAASEAATATEPTVIAAPPETAEPATKPSARPGAATWKRTAPTASPVKTAAPAAPRPPGDGDWLERQH